MQNSVVDYKRLLALAALQIIIYSFWMLTHNDFKYIILDYVPAMIGVIALQVFAYTKRKEGSAKWIIGGVLVSFFATAIQQSGFTIHQHFNYNDLYHVIQMGAMYLLYRGGCLLKDRRVA